MLFRFIFHLSCVFSRRFYLSHSTRISLVLFRVSNISINQSSQAFKRLIYLTLIIQPFSTTNIRVVCHISRQISSRNSLLTSIGEAMIDQSSERYLVAQDQFRLFLSYLALTGYNSVLRLSGQRPSKASEGVAGQLWGGCEAVGGR